ncbi:MAG TPA: TIGR01841 family phasin [Acetobacteraceae bacterium]
MSDDPAAKMQNTMTQAASGATQMGKTAMDAGMAKMAEFTKMFTDMKVPGIAGMPDMDAFLSAHRRNMEVLTAANRVALEGAQAVARRHMEIMQQTMSEMTETMRDLSSPDSPSAKAAKQTELIKASYERAVAHMKELADLIQRANGEALGMLNQRFAEAMDEVKLLASKAGKTPAG